MKAKTIFKEFYPITLLLTVLMMWGTVGVTKKAESEVRPLAPVTAEQLQSHEVGACRNYDFLLKDLVCKVKSIPLGYTEDDQGNSRASEASLDNF